MRIKKPVNLANISSDLGSPGAAIDWDLIDNNSSALSFDADGKAGILNIVTTDGAEGVELSGFLSVDGATTLNNTLNINSNALLSGGGADGKLILSNLAADQGVLFDTSTDGQLTLTDESSGALNLRIDGRIFDGAGPLNLGTAAATGHSLTAGDVLIGGKLEVKDAAYFEEDININGQATCNVPSTLVPFGTTQTIDWNDGNIQVLDLENASGDVTLTFTNGRSGGSYLLLVIQGPNSRNITWDSCAWENGATPTITAADNAKDLVSLNNINGTYYASISQNMS